MSARAPSARRLIGRLVLATAALLAVALPACVSLERGGLYALDGDSVHVAWLGNDTFFRQVEFDLTEQIAQEILSRPGLHLTSREDAEILLEGRVTRVNQGVLSEDPSRTLTARTTTIAVTIVVRDGRTGEVLGEHELNRTADFVPDLDETLESARVDVYRYLARDIVRVLETEF